MAAKNKVTIEDRLSKLEDLVARLESDDIPLEDALAAFEEGVKLTREAQEVLKKTEQRVQKLLEKDGEPKAEPFIEDDV